MTVTPDLLCRDLVELVTEHLEGVLDPATEATLVQHLAECTGCSDHVEQVRAAVRLSQALPAEDVPADLTARLLALHRQQR